MFLLKKYLLFIVSLFYCLTIYSQKTVIKLHFQQNSSLLQLNELSKLDTIITSINKLSKDTNRELVVLRICGYASPEGALECNRRLALRRAEFIAEIIRKQTFLQDSLIKIVNGGIGWSILREQIDHSNIEYRQEILEIIDNIPEDFYKIRDAHGFEWDSRKKRLMDLYGGKPYHYMYTHFFPEIRNVCIIAIEYKIKNNLSYTDQLIPVIYPFMLEQSKSSSLHILTPIKKIENKLFLAVKTNLLYDLLTMFNINVELPLGNNLSLVGGYIGSWCRDYNNQFSLQIVAGQMEIKYWFSPKAANSMHGFNVGLYGSCGKYDIQLFTKNGHQGKFSNLGLTFAYVQKLSQSFRLAYSIGLGYQRCDDKLYYQYHDTELGKIKVRKYPWRTDSKIQIVPLNVGVTVSWLLFKS